MRSDAASVAGWRVPLDRRLVSPLWWEIAAVLLVVAAAAVFRLQHLSWIPYGITGDEANFGSAGS